MGKKKFIVRKKNTVTGNISLNEIQKDGIKHSEKIDEHDFPLHVFPESIRKLIMEANKIVGFPKDYLAGSILAAVSVAIGNSVQFRVRSTQLESPLLYMALVGAAGINKSHPLNYAFKPIYKKDKELYERYKEELRVYESESQRYKDATKRERSTMERMEAPALVQYVVSDSTIEALMVSHDINQRGIGYHRDELMGWVNDFNKYRAGSDVEMWLSIFSGQPIRIDRKTGDNKHLRIQKPFISVVGTIQYDILWKLRAGNKSDNGFLDRILFILPKTLIKPMEFNIDIIPHSLSLGYESIINKLFALEYIEDDVSVLNFSDASLSIFKNWYTKQAKQYNNLAETDFKRRIYPKIETYVTRFAVVLQMLHWADNPMKYSNEKIDGAIMQVAIDLGDYFFMMALKAREAINNSNFSSGDEKKIAAKLLRSNNVSFRDIGKLLNVSHVSVQNWLKE